MRGAESNRIPTDYESYTNDNKINLLKQEMPAIATGSLANQKLLEQFSHAIRAVSPEFTPIPNDGVHIVSWSGVLNNLVPVTLGNIVSGVLFMGIPYYFISYSKSVPKQELRNY